MFSLGKWQICISIDVLAENRRQKNPLENNNEFDLCIHIYLGYEGTYAWIVHIWQWKRATTENRQNANRIAKDVFRELIYMKVGGKGVAGDGFG